MIKFNKDNRYDPHNIVTHDNIKVQAIKCSMLKEVDHLINDYDVILIDEIQFYNDADVYCEQWANTGKVIEACGLNGKFDRSPFPIISKLLPLVDNITFLKAVCRSTGNDAVFTKYNNHNNKVSSNKIIIGGTDLYKAVDRYTYFNS
jgi:thymidine kinase